ncbi:hypothetical protein GYMLUDRAFT_46163 [Collybiopsis luxurians FD-317 M1]|uniref:Ras-GEF domain-containing protein n=1 Tax=Collybiopsis luxurians FD-317 M1 TaxID=944289 RepID=A0A0D0B322_9AGAR|nr:hypothetical protein GYMLUDRAFT_46163 [Collybiopsis luxurians FD-317 M1]
MNPSPLSSSPPSLPPISSLSSSPNNDSLSVAISTAIPNSDEDSSDNEAESLPPGLTHPPGLSFETTTEPLGLPFPHLGPTSAPTSPPPLDAIPRIPVPTVSAGGETVSFAYPDPKDEGDADSGYFSILRRPLPPDMAGADIVIAPDSSYIETSSGPCARELKKRYDALYGVTVTTRSPYAIVAFVGQHGQQRFRVGHRDMAAPGAKVDDVPTTAPPSSKSPQSSRRSKSNSKSKSTSLVRSPVGSTKSPASSLASGSGSEPPFTSPTTSPRASHHAQAKSQSYSRASKRHSKGRISINALLGSGTQTSPAGAGAGSGIPPSGTAAGGGGGARKLKKPRSNPDLSLSGNAGQRPPPSSYHYPNLSSQSGSSGGRMHSLSVTATDMPHVIGIDPLNPYQVLPQAYPEKKGDAFGEVMGWAFSSKGGKESKDRDHALHNQSSVSTMYSASASAPSTSYAAGSGNHSGFFDADVPGDALSPTSGLNTATPSSVSGTATGAAAASFVARPFGPGVYFDIPGVSHASSSGTRPKSSQSVNSNGSSSTSTSTSSESDTDFGKFLKVSPSKRFRMRERNGSESGTGAGNLREMQSFESGLTVTAGHGGGGRAGRTPIATSFSMDASRSRSTSASASSPTFGMSSMQPLQVDLSLAEVDFGEIVRVVERQRSAIRLSERDGTGMGAGTGGVRSSVTVNTAVPAEDAKAEASTSVSPSSPERPSASGSVSSTPASSPVKSRLSMESAEHPLHKHPDTSDIDSIMQRDNHDHGRGPRLSSLTEATPPVTGSTSASSASLFTPTSTAVAGTAGPEGSGDGDGDGDQDQDQDPAMQTPQTPRPSQPVPRVQMYLPPSLPPRLAKFTAYSTDIFDVLQTSRGLPLLDLLDEDEDGNGDGDGDSIAEEEGEGEDGESIDEFIVDTDFSPATSSSSSSSSKSPLVSSNSLPASSSKRNGSKSKSKRQVKTKTRTHLPETVPVKLTLAQDDSAAPKDDPRFVIWGKVGSLHTGGVDGGAGGEHQKEHGNGAGGSIGGFGDGGSSTASHETSSSASSASGMMKGKGKGLDLPVSSLSANGADGAHTSRSLSLSIPGSSTHSSSGRSRSGSGAAPGAGGAGAGGGDYSDDNDDGSGSPKPRVLLAATIERWLAQLTSDLDYDELLNFFLTYRTYIGPLDLARLLMARFCWALGSSSGPAPPTSASPDERSSSTPLGDTFQFPRASFDLNHDDVVRRIVRVRTFVAFKQWFITFFAVDFVPNRDLRLYVASHLNDLGRELVELGKEVERAVEIECLRSSKEGRVLGKKETAELKDVKERELGMSRGAIMDGISIVKKLKKVAKDCKKLYTTNNSASLAQSQSSSTPAQSPPPKFRKSFTFSRNTGDDATNGSSTHPGGNLFGANFAAATRKLSAASAASAPDADDSDVDLDFISEDDPSSRSMMSPFSYGGVYGSSPVNFGGASTLNLGTTISPPGPGSIPLSSLTILQRTDHAPGPEGFYGASTVMSNGSTQIPHNPLSRVLVKTLGRLGRWKRVLNSGGVAHGVNMHRSMAAGGRLSSYPHGGGVAGGGLARMAAACADVSAFDVELTVDSSDLLSSSRGVESYLRLVDSQQTITAARRNIQQVPSATASPAPTPSSVPVNSPPKVLTSLPAAEPPVTTAPGVPVTVPNNSEPSEDKQSVAESTIEPSTSSELRQSTVSETSMVSETPSLDYSESGGDLNRVSVAESAFSDDYGVVTNIYRVQDSPTESSRMSQGPAPSTRDSRATHSTRRTSRTSSTDSFGEPLSASRASARFPAFTSPYQFDVVSLDELSDISSDERGSYAAYRGAPAGPPGLRQPPRRLPLRREFEFLDRPETVSSMGIISRSSIVSAGSASGQSTASRASTSSAAGGLGGNIQQWQMNALKSSVPDDDDEPGDVDEALKRLEGQINPQKQLENASKVDGWVKTIRERLAAGDYSDEEPMFSSDEDDNEEREQGADDERENPTGPHDSSLSSESISATTPSSTDKPVLDVDPCTEAAKIPHADQIASPARSTEAKPAVEDAVPLEILQSRLSSETPSVTPDRVVSVTSKFVDPSSGPKAHRSFILNFKAEDLAQHFAMIDRELFMTIKFDELLLEDWMYTEEVDTLDWAQFLKDRARWKAESRWPEKTSALGAVRARFNLMVNFTLSEIVLTNQAERAIVFSKFLRIAWKSYLRSSFTTLVAILTGLQSPWVGRAMNKSMHRLKEGDSRMLADLKVFTSSKDNFKHIRSAVDAINDAKPFEPSSHGPSVAGSGSAAEKNATPSACVPFIGTYLSQLYQYNQLPVLIDPTAPSEVVTYDPESSNLSLPAHPQVFSTLAPLPSSMHLEPLINVHRQRLIAGVIKSLVAGQHLASRVQFPIDKKLFHKCLRIRGLDSNTLERALVLLPD